MNTPADTRPHLRGRGVLLAIMLVGCFQVLGCDRTPRQPSPSSAVVDAGKGIGLVTTSSRTPPDNTVSACPHTGLWALCNVEKRLKQSGFVVMRVRGDSPQRAGFTVTPVAYTLGRDARLEVFIYADALALARDMAKIDTLAVGPAGVPSSWETTPILIRSENLAAVLLSRSPRQADRLTLALTAGAPQPGSPR